MKLKNYTEKMLQYALADFLKLHQLPCDCPICQADILSLALNQLPSQYYVSKTEEMRIKIESLQPSEQVKVMVALVNAIHQVGKNPSHLSLRALS